MVDGKLSGMNVSGAILAAWYTRRDTKESEDS